MSRIADLLAKIAKDRRELAGSEHHAAELRRELAALEAAVRHIDHSRPVPRAGVDYSFARPNPGALRRAGASFAVRYVTGQGKALTHSEALGLSSAGIELVTCFESTGTRMAAGYAAGAADAHQAAAALHAASGGQANSRPIYFVCDFDASGAGTTGQVMEYLRGAVHAIGWERVGLYAGLGPIETAAAMHRCRFLWQTLAWSGGRWSPHAQLRQTEIEVVRAGARVDLDTAVAADFGQWKA